MGESVFHKYFGKDFTGINAECSAIEQEGGEVNRAVNLEWALSNNLRGRTGRQLVGTPGDFFGLHSHNYSLVLPRYELKWSTTAPKIQSTLVNQSGETVTEMIGMNGQLFRLQNKSYTVKLSGSGAGTYTWWTYVGNGVAGTGPTSGNIYFKLQKNGTDIIGTGTNGFDCGTGLERPGTVGGLKTIYDLLVAIDATSDIDVTFDRSNIGPMAIKDAFTGAAAVSTLTELGNAWQINTNGGIYTLEYGDPIVFQTGDNGVGVGYNLLVGGFQWDVSALLFRPIVPNPNYTYTYSGQVFGYPGQPAASFPIQTVQTFTGNAASTFSLVFPTWVWIPTPINNNTIFYPLFESPRIGYYEKWPNYKPPSFNSQNGVCYIAATDHYISKPTVANPGLYPDQVKKYDTQSVYAAGWVTPAIPTRAAGAATLAAGSYKYKYYLRRIDSQNNYIESNPSPVLTYISVGGANSSALMRIPMATVTWKYSNQVWFHCYAQKIGGAGDQVFAGGIGPISVCKQLTATGTGQSLLNVGDPIFFINKTDGTLHRTFITQIDQSTANYTKLSVADSTAFTIGQDSILSCGVTAVLLRTLNGNNQYYQVAELPCGFYDAATAVTYDDSVTDANLTAGIRYTEIEIGKEHDAPPSSTLLCDHQGMMIYAGSPDQPNTISFSIPGSPEYVPLATNNFDVPSTQKGNITAIISDSANHLATFKEAAYYDIQGDLDSGAIDPQVKTEGDYGITSHKTLARINGTLYGLSKLGIIGINEGNLDVQVARKLNARIINQPWIFKWATAVNDPGTRAYILNIPTGQDTRHNVESQTFVIDYSRQGISFLEQSFSSGYNPSGGSVSLGDDFYQCSFDKYATTSNFPVGIVSRRIQRFINNSPTGNDGLCFNDGGQKVNYILETQPINKGEPSLLKTLIRGRLFSIPNDYIAEGWVPFDTKVEVGVFPDASYIGDANNGGSTINLSFTSIINWLKDFQPRPVNAFCYLLRFTTSTLFQAPFFTGYELVFKAPEAKEDLQKP